MGTYDFLSNFHTSPCEFEGKSFPSVEHAYQAAKTTDKMWKAAITDAPTPGESKKLGRRCPVREDWEEIKLSVMEELVRSKFSNPKLSQKLLETNDKLLVEGNTWGDTFWGVCNGRGENHLGKILMKVRSELKEKN